MNEFIDGPCGWSREAPAALRRRVVGDASEWRKYSTSRFLFNLEPVVLHTAGIARPPSDSGIRVELLPEVVAGRWRNLGLEFASEADMREAGFLELLEKSLDLVRTVLPLHGTVLGLCRSLHVLVASGPGFDVSYSDPTLPFSVFVSCPPATECNRVERLAENIMHEALHLQLTLVEGEESLISRGTGETPMYSPWKNECRAVHGVMHAVYVFGNLRCFWKHAADDLPESSFFAQSRIETIERELEATRHVSASRYLTPTGRRMARSLLVPRWR